MIIRHVTSYRFEIPFRETTHVASFALTKRRGVLFAVEGDDGLTGWGEASPLSGFSKETLDEVIASAQQAAQKMCGRPLEEVKGYIADGAITLPSLRFALENAFRQIEADATGQSPRCLLQGNSPATVSLCALAAGNVATIPGQVERAVQAGYKSIKIKVGADPINETVALVHTLRRNFAEACRLRFDANRAWDFEDALRFCSGVAGDDVEYIEEPLSDPTGMERLHKQCGIPCAVDETLQELNACMYKYGRNSTSKQETTLRHIVESAQVMVWKPSLCVSPECMSLETAAPIVLSGAYESGVGTAAILDYAAATGSGNFAAGVDTYSRLAEDVLDECLPLFGGEADLRAVADALRTLNLAKLTQVWHV